jgi:lipopolysaccharide transport protein LptA
MIGFTKIPLLFPRYVALTLLLLQAPAGFAAPVNNDRVEVQADYMKFDLDTGSSTYEGNVIITHNNIEIYGETVIILSESNEIQQINVDGQPARYIQDEHTENSI